MGIHRQFQWYYRTSSSSLQSFRLSLKNTSYVEPLTKVGLSRKSELLAAVLKWDTFCCLQASFPFFPTFRPLINDGTRTQWDRQYLKIGQFLFPSFLGLSFLIQKKKFRYLPACASLLFLKPIGSFLSNLERAIMIHQALTIELLQAALKLIHRFHLIFPSMFYLLLGPEDGNYS